MNRRPGRPRSGPDMRATILKATVEELADVGFAAARIESIARRAGCNRALVYFYFPDRLTLFDAAIEAAADYRAGQMSAQPETLAEGLIYWFRRNLAEPERLRLIMQEALAASDGLGPGREGAPVPAARSDYLEGQLRVVGAFQKAGLLRADIDARHLLLAILALTSFPACFPQISRAILARESQAASEREWEAALTGLSAVLAPAR